MTSKEPNKRYPLLGLVAYALVPGERRARASAHFRRAGIEAVRGVGSLVMPEVRAREDAAGREHIKIE